MRASDTLETIATMLGVPRRCWPDGIVTALELVLIEHRGMRQALAEARGAIRRQAEDDAAREWPKLAGADDH